MAFKFIAHLRRVLILLNAGVIIVYLLVCLVPFLNTGDFWFIALAGLGFPVLFFVLVLFIILWGFYKSKWWWISAIALIFGFQQIKVVFAFNFPKEFSLTRQPHSLRVMQWNLTSWDKENKNESKSFRPLMMDLVQSQQADVLCFEEFVDLRHSDKWNRNTSVMEKMGFAYHFFVPSVNYYNKNNQGIAIFSRYPIIDTASFSFSENNIGEHLIYADIKVDDRIIRVFCTHLQSVHFDQTEYKTLNRLKRAKDPGLEESRTIVSKLKRGYESRYRQGKLVQQKITECPYPAIICGDFNDVPNSSTYFNVKGKLQDAFIQKGTGLGRTFRFISPTLRIDYILADKQFKVNQFKTIHVPYSDHYPLVTDLQY